MTNIDINSLNRAINGLSRDITQVGQALESQISVVDTKVVSLGSDIELTTRELRELKSAFDEFVQQAARTARVQQSETKIVNLKAELDRRFGHYGVVRRTSTGLLQAFDIGNVTNDVARAVSEELMIQTPRYWLAPAIVALSAWSLDNEDIAARSVQEAYSRDPKKVSLFFALVLRRQGRTESAVRWLRHYFASLDPLALTREFAVILESISYDAFGPAGQKLLTERLGEWCADLRNKPEIVEEQIQSWVEECEGEQQTLGKHEYSTLRTVSPEWSQVQGSLEAASALPQLIDKYTAVRNHDSPLPTALEDLLDDILDDLVREYDDEELPLRRDVTYHEAIVDEHGDEDRAKSRAAALQQALEDTRDVVSLQTQSAISPRALGVSTQTQRLAIGVGQSDFRTAVGRYCTNYRNSYAPSVSIQLDKNHTAQAELYGFPGWRTQTDSEEEVAVKQLTMIWHKLFDELRAKASFNPRWYVKPGLITAAVAIVAMFINPGLGIMAALFGVAATYFFGEQEKAKANAAAAAIDSARTTALDESVAMYRDALAEFVDSQQVYQHLDSQETELIALIDGWPTAESPAKEMAS